MFDFLLCGMLALPPLGAMLAGRYIERGLIDATKEVQVQRKYRLSWLLFFIMQAQLVLLWLLIENFGDKMEWAILVGRGLMDVVGGYFSLLYLSALRVERIIKRTQGGEAGSKARKAQLRLTLRGTFGSLLPMVLWLGMVAALPIGFLADPAHLK